MDKWTVEVTLTKPDGSRVASQTFTQDHSEVGSMVLMSAEAVRDQFVRQDA